MSLYSTHNNSGKAILIIIGTAILAFTVGYSFWLASAFKDMEKKRVILQSLALKIAKTKSESDLYELIFYIQDTLSVPIILEGEKGRLEGHHFEPASLNTDSTFLAQKRKEFLSSGSVPLEGRDYYKYIYYLESPYIRYLEYFPGILALLVGMYILLGYLMFNAFKKSEQSKVWAGMAKETAHQLGTPISALLFGIENMKECIDDKEAMGQMIENMEKYVGKLELVADRFSKIGSVPVLESVFLFETIEDVGRYMQELAPSKVAFHFERPENDVLVGMNRHLFSWVIENIINNSLNAMNGKGNISCTLHLTNNHVEVWISDTGHGIPLNQFKKIFQPGYSTKKRGWGLGLSLAKRIVEEYHKGKIWVKESVPHERTTFVISLPLLSA
ncbi:MAG: HAMP domain-containing histidine kinase [Saprospiraceae bacterium]|nr:HAMP domain-containing histidine kinase [Saprospiraceae bacterium]